MVRRLPDRNSRRRLCGFIKGPPPTSTTAKKHPHRSVTKAPAVKYRSPTAHPTAILHPCFVTAPVLTNRVQGGRLLPSEGLPLLRNWSIPRCSSRRRRATLPSDFRHSPFLFIPVPYTCLFPFAFEKRDMTSFRLFLIVLELICTLDGVVTGQNFVQLCDT